LGSTLEARWELVPGKEILDGISMFNAQLEDAERLLFNLRGDYRDVAGVR
jgi:hypothetical protein